MSTARSPIRTPSRQGERCRSRHVPLYTAMCCSGPFPIGAFSVIHDFNAQDGQARPSRWRPSSRRSAIAAPRQVSWRKVGGAPTVARTGTRRCRTLLFRPLLGNRVAHSGRTPQPDEPGRYPSLLRSRQPRYRRPGSRPARISVDARRPLGRTRRRPGAGPRRSRPPSRHRTDAVVRSATGPFHSPPRSSGRLIEQSVRGSSEEPSPRCRGERCHPGGLRTCSTL